MKLRFHAGAVPLVLLAALCCALPTAAQTGPPRQQPAAAQTAPRADSPAEQQAAAAQAGPRADSPLKQQMKEFERFADLALRKMFGNLPFTILQEPKASYLPGFGLIVHAEGNLYPMRMLTPFGRPTYSEEELKVEREQKIARIKQLRATLREMLVQEAPLLAKLGGSENAALVVHLFNQRPYPEVPDQVVVIGNLRDLAALQGRKLQPGELDKLVSLREY